MNFKTFLILIICISCFFSCGKSGSNPQNMLLGTWTMQHQQVVVYQDSTKIVDTTLSAAANTYGSVQFISDSTYSSSSVYDPSNSLQFSGPPPTNQKSNGKYSYSGGVFTISPGLAGWYTLVLGSTGPPTNVSQSISITQLTSSHLTVHDENKFTVTGATGTHSYDLLFNSYYTK